jgi:DNA-binding response OmpR family regulator
MMLKRRAYIPDTGWILDNAHSQILLIDHDERFRNTLAQSLRQEGFKVAVAADGKSALGLALSAKVALIITELSLPGRSGLDICENLRTAGIKTPIIVLSSAGEETDKVNLLDSGADDFVVKTAGMRELLARIRAVLRRAARQDRIISFAEVRVDRKRGIVTRSGVEVKLSPGEYRLLCFFLQHQDCLVSRFTILSSVWGLEPHSNTRKVDAYVPRLRNKLEAIPATPRHFLAYKEFGYRFVP